MGTELPKGWCWATLGIVANERVEQDGPSVAGLFKYVDIGSVDNLSKRITSAKELQALEAPSRARQNLRLGDVVVSMTRPNLNAVALLGAEFDGAIGSTGFHVLRSRNMNPSWLFYAVQTRQFVGAMCMLVQGALYPAVRPKDINAWLCPIPPLAEQARIADKLDELLSDLDAGVAALEGVRAKLKHFRAAVLKAAVEGSLTAEWRAQHPATEPATAMLTRVLAERRRRWEAAQLQKFQKAGKTPPKNWQAKYQEPTAPDTTHLPKLPEGWCWASLDQLTGESLIGLDRGLQFQKDTPPGVPYIKMNNVTMDGRVTYECLPFVDADEDEQSRYELSDGDLLFNTRNSKELVGKIGIVRNPPSGAVYNNNLMRLRFDGACLSAFTCLQMCGPPFRTRMEAVKKATTSVAAVYAKDLFPLALAIPPLAEQSAIVELVEDQLSMIDHLEADLAAKVKSAQALRQSILRDAFAGQLVPQDPNDEPASELLKRIAAEREERAQAAKAARKTAFKPGAARKRVLKT
jgi:type I restriction enzyme S subunit